MFARWKALVEEACASAQTSQAIDLYCGRSFREALSVAAAPNYIWIVSAGLGLVRGTQCIPSYSLTLAPNSPDSISNAIVSFDAREWWSALSQLQTSSGHLIDLCRTYPECIIVMALSTNYYKLVEGDLLSLGKSALSRIRIMGLSLGLVSPEVARVVMPYDLRLDGPDSKLPGTRSDFPQRALRHFVTEILSAEPKGSAGRHAEMVRESLDGMRFPRKRTRLRLSDSQIRSHINSEWAAVGGRSASMLRRLRDELGIACEQSRFAKLFKQVKAARGVAEYE